MMHIHAYVSTIYIVWGAFVVLAAPFGVIRFRWSAGAAALAAIAGCLWILAGIQHSDAIALVASSVMVLWMIYHIPRHYGRPQK